MYFKTNIDIANILYNISYFTSNIDLGKYTELYNKFIIIFRLKGDNRIINIQDILYNIDRRGNGSIDNIRINLDLRKLRRYLED